MITGLEGKTVLVTEAAHNFGSAIALAFAGEGANLLLASAGRSELIEPTAREASELGVRVITSLCDTSDEDQVQELVEKCLSEFGQLDVLVNNALLPLSARSFAEIPFGEWQRKIQLEVTGSFFLCKAVLPRMIEQGWGRVINFTGLEAFEGMDATSSAAQFGMVGLTRGIAREYGKHNITANCIGPAGIEAPEAEGTHPESADTHSALPRWGKPEEVACLAVCLASEGAGYITGQCLLSNGGRYFL